MITTSAIKLACVCALMAGAVLLPLHLWRNGQSIERERAQQVKENEARLASLLEETLRLSNAVVQAKGSELSSAQLAELLKLRGEIGQLRQASAEASNLLSRNAQLVAALTNTTGSPVGSSLPEGQTVLAHWPRSDLSFAGYSDPTAALKTLIWAMVQGDTNVLAEGVTPEIKARMMRQDWIQHRSPSEELAEAASKIAESLQPVTDFYVVGQRTVSQDQVVFDVFFEGEGRIRKFAMKNVGDGWKFNALGLAAATDSDVHSGFSSWP